MRPPTTSRSRALRLTTVAVLFTFGCASVRAPATVIPEVIPIRDGRAEPQLALWVEGGEAPTPAEQQAAGEKAQRALVDAAQGLEAPAGEDGILVVRAQGLTRTSGRRSNQVAGAVGLVVGIVVVVAVVILAIAEGKGGGGGGGRSAKPSGARAAPAPVRPGGAAVGAGKVVRGGTRAAPAPAPVTRAPRPIRPGRPGPGVRPAPPPHAVPPRYPHDGVYVWGDPWVSWGIHLDLTPEPTPYVYPAPSPAGFQQPVDSYVVAPAGEAAAAGEEELEDELAFEVEPAPPELSELRLGPPEPLPIDDRGFFAGDDLMLELVVVDRVTGEPRLRKVVRKDVDPTDAVAVKAFLREAVAEKRGWEPVVATVTPAP